MTFLLGMNDALNKLIFMLSNFSNYYVDILKKLIDEKERQDIALFGL